MKLGFIIPDYPGERRRALLPEHIDHFPNEITIESGYGRILGLPDSEYASRGCRVASRDEVFAHCEAIMHLKLLQPGDYGRLRPRQVMVGWTHPDGNGAAFMPVAARLDLAVLDLDNTHPALYAGGRQTDLRPMLPRDFVRENSVYAGEAAVFHALSSYGSLPAPGTCAAVLSAGNVAQGAYTMLTRLGVTCRMFTRSTLNEFYESMADYDVVVNGIGIAPDEKPILTKEAARRLRRGALVIDAAADYDGAIENSVARPISDPLHEVDGVWYWCVDNIPTVFYREASRALSRDFSRWVYRRDILDFLRFAQVVSAAESVTSGAEPVPGATAFHPRGWNDPDQPPWTPRPTVRVA